MAGPLTGRLGIGLTILHHKNMLYAIQLMTASEMDGLGMTHGNV